MLGQLPSLIPRLKAWSWKSTILAWHVFLMLDWCGLCHVFQMGIHWSELSFTYLEYPTWNVIHVIYMTQYLEYPTWNVIHVDSFDNLKSQIQHLTNFLSNKIIKIAFKNSQKKKITLLHTCECSSTGMTNSNVTKKITFKFFYF